jgi:hypothetical protein
MSNDEPQNLRQSGQLTSVPGQLPAVRCEGAIAIAAVAVGALALSVVAMGALAIGKMAIGQLAPDRARVRGGGVDDLVIARLTIRERAIQRLR